MQALTHGINSNSGGRGCRVSFCCLGVSIWREKFSAIKLRKTAFFVFDRTLTMARRPCEGSGLTQRGGRHKGGTRG